VRCRYKLDGNKGSYPSGGRGHPPIPRRGETRRTRIRLGQITVIVGEGGRTRDERQKANDKRNELRLCRLPSSLNGYAHSLCAWPCRHEDKALPPLRTYPACVCDPKRAESQVPIGNATNDGSTWSDWAVLGVAQVCIAQWFVLTCIGLWMRCQADCRARRRGEREREMDGSRAGGAGVECMRMYAVRSGYLQLATGENIQKQKRKRKQTSLARRARNSVRQPIVVPRSG